MQSPIPTESSPEDADQPSTAERGLLAAEVLEARLMVHRAVLGRLLQGLPCGEQLSWLEDRSFPLDGQEDPGAVPALAAATAAADEYRCIAEIVRATKMIVDEPAVPPSRWTRLAATAVSAGLSGALVSAATLAVLGLLVSGTAMQPLNPTAHWLYKEQAAMVAGVDLGVTGTAILTHLVASLFWGAVLTTVLELRSPRGAGSVIMLGIGTGLVALTVNYAILPEVLSPGWQLVLPPWGVLSGFLEFGLGLGLGALAVWRRSSGAILARSDSRIGNSAIHS